MPNLIKKSLTVSNSDVYVDGPESKHKNNFGPYSFWVAQK